MSPLVTDLQDAAKAASHRVRAALGQAGGVVPVVRLEGPIAAPAMSGGLGRGTLNLAGAESVLRRAFETDDAVAVALVLNSPGGSPAQSELIAARIRQLAAKHELPVLAFCEDVAASGGYWLACAADEIFVTTTSIVGSIGVISASFGAKELIGKIGLERRVFTEGDAKHRLDMFEDVREGDVEWLHGLQGDIHGAFREWVTSRRGERLGDDPALFTGEVWIGRKAVDLGLADGVGTLRGVLEERFPDAEIEAMHTPKPLFARLLGGTAIDGAGLASSVTAGVLDGAIAGLQRRGLWANFGA
ncbi:S49 family peptidase [Tsukamurella ocularis]|uniref:S49 family peptidase n=1 Tax=Tsukamurella ocularis TaxID=1970234 RepID=UPI002169FE3C|nr:S49 family peptidase [Tsukamurella ocularis]MCS3781586.1 signal peptide peptidase SppA [Tsukamurella ocularis]MCS3787958.1 signal peptide peptidase SppA [Tsukamurella ocularis]MCS3851253.1 signal peptide peptidase SppA [Tsukamurella ocularis]